MTFRVLVTDPMDAASNMAIDNVLLEGCAGGQSPPTLRFMQFSPPGVLVGAFQRVEHEVRLAWCREHGIDINRRLTGGGAIFFDESQLGWEVVCLKEHLGGAGVTESLFERLCLPVVTMLREMGIDASFRPRNDIEVDGRKISGTGGTSLGDAILFQGTLLTDFDAQTMVRALKVPVEKLRRREIEAMTQRVTWMGRELEQVPATQELIDLLAGHFSSTLGIDLERGELTDGEREALVHELPRFQSDDWILGQGKKSTTQVRSLYPTAGGMLRPVIRTDERKRRIESMILDGDFFAFPRRGVLDLEAALKGARVENVGPVVKDLFSNETISIPHVTAEDVVAAIEEALDRAQIESLGFTTRQVNSTFTVCARLDEIARLRPTHLLVPYCAKPPDCEHRSLDSCDQCGDCTIGDSYVMGQSTKLEVHSITSFEHLMQTLAELEKQGVSCWMGSCCEPFYIKHREEMESFGLPGILFDVANNETCYDLGKGSEAYAGRYEGRSEMDIPLLEALLSICCACPGDETKR